MENLLDVIKHQKTNIQIKFVYPNVHLSLLEAMNMLLGRSPCVALSKTRPHLWFREC